MKGSNSQLSPSRQVKHGLPTLYNEETISNVQEEKRKQMKFKEQEEKKRLKQKDDYFENNKSNEIHQKGQAKIKSKYLNKKYFIHFFYFKSKIFKNQFLQKLFKNVKINMNIMMPEEFIVMIIDNDEQLSMISIEIYQMKDMDLVNRVVQRVNHMKTIV